LATVIPCGYHPPMPVESIIPFLDAESLKPAEDTELGLILSSSSRLGWDGIHIERGRNQHFRADNVVVPQHYFAMNFGTELRWRTKVKGDFMPLATQPGEIWVNPAHTPFTNIVDEPSEFVLLTIDPEKLTQAVFDSKLARPFAYRQQFNANDPLMRALILGFLAEAEAGGSNGRVLIDSLTTAFAVHYIQHYGQGVPEETGPREGLDARRLKRAMDLLDSRFAEDLSLEDIARDVAMSKFHLIRQFKLSTGLSPYQYLLKRRLERAKTLLLQGSLPIGQIALAVGFGDQSQFNKHFKREFGTTPAALRKG
jgi:AraC family transcriptional regulator